MCTFVLSKYYYYYYYYYYVLYHMCTPHIHTCEIDLPKQGGTECSAGKSLLPHRVC